MSRPKTLEVSLSDLALMIDHSLLHPTMTDDEVLSGLEICKKYNVKTGQSPSIPRTPQSTPDTQILISSHLTPTSPKSINSHSSPQPA